MPQYFSIKRTVLKMPHYYNIAKKLFQKCLANAALQKHFENALLILKRKKLF
jgi:hypothetical protein